MINIPGYRIKEDLGEDGKTIKIRAIESDTNKPVIMRILYSHLANAVDVELLKHDYEISNRINGKYTLNVLDLKRIPDAHILICEDFTGIPLKKILEQQKISVDDFLHLAIQLAEAIHGIHKSRIAHNCINSNNIYVDLTKNSVKIAGFADSSELSDDGAVIETGHGHLIQLHYASPEQTGRMKRRIDYRTDFYSLGVVFYEMLLGFLPFEAEDDIELIHSHLAKKAISPHDHDNNIPKTLSDIVMKLMEKIADDRYKSALGLKNDLAECLIRHQSKSPIDDFKPGLQDLFDRFSFPRTLFGRENEIKFLLSAFGDTCQGKKESIMVAGYSGIGKSSLVQEIQKPVIQANGLFISGKFDQYQRDIPYSALIQAFTLLIRWVLSQNESQIQIWRKDLIGRLGTDARVIIDVIPELEMIIGKQPEAAELPFQENRSRFNSTILRFIGTFCRQEHPLVIFLDDLQWADSSSLAFIELLIREKSQKYMLLIGSYRQNEIGDNPQLKQFIDNMRSSSPASCFMDLKPLEPFHVSSILSEAFGCGLDEVADLSLECIRKTSGNPYFLKHFLHSLYVENQIRFNYEKQKWEWDLQNIRTTDVTDNVIDLISLRIDKLSVDAADTLKVAACIGNKIDFNILSRALGKETEHAKRSLYGALKEGLLTQIENDQYAFPHDRIRQAVYSLIPDQLRKKTHLTIGRIIMSDADSSQQGDKLLDIINHFNLATELIKSFPEQQKIAGLELSAGRRSMRSAAYQESYRYFKAGIALIDTYGWDYDYDLVFSLYVEAGKAAYLAEDFESLEVFAQKAIKNSKTVYDRVKVLEIKIAACSAMNEMDKAIGIGLDALWLLGLKLPRNPNRLDVLKSVLQTRMALNGKKPGDLLELPQMKNTGMMAADRIFGSMAMSVYKYHRNLFALMVLKMLRLYLKYGNHIHSSVVYVCYSVMLSAMGRVETARRFGEVALKLLEGSQIKDAKVKALSLYLIFMSHWKLKIPDYVKSFAESHSLAIESGNVDIACLCAFEYGYHSFYSGSRLDSLENEMHYYDEAIRNVKQKEFLYNQLIYHQAVQNLMGLNDQPCSLKGVIYDRDEMLPFHLREKDRNPLCGLYMCEMVLCYIFGNYEKSLHSADSALEYSDGLHGNIGIQNLYFYKSLALLSLYDKQSDLKKRITRIKTARYQKRMKTWSETSPWNFGGMYLLVEAERARIANKNTKATRYYEEAVKHSAENGYLHLEAIANECAARFYLSGQNTDRARNYLRNALNCYNLWGAAAKVRQLEEVFPQFSLNVDALNKGKDLHVISDNKIDLLSIIKVSQALSGEIDLNGVIQKLMRFLTEYAGAQRCCLLMEIENKWRIVAGMESDEGGMQISSAFPESKEISEVAGKYEEGCLISNSIVNYVIRAKCNVLLNDAHNDSDFVNDPYIRRFRPRSVLCSPLVRQGKLTGVLYLENNLTPSAFTEERVNMLNIMTSQITISLENALLYANMEQKILMRTKELNESNTELNKMVEKLKQHAETVEELAIEKERNRFALDVHDNTGHSLVLLIKLLEMCRLHYRKDTDKGESTLTEAINAAREGLANLRRAIHGLAPQRATGNNLIEVIKQLVEDFRSSNISVELEAKEINYSHSPAQIRALYNVCKESMTNSIKHGHASLIKIGIYYGENALRLRLSDDGTGCAAINKGFGLNGMERRIGELGGTIEFNSGSVNGGFEIEAEIPLGDTNTGNSSQSSNEVEK